MCIIFYKWGEKYIKMIILEDQRKRKLHGISRRKLGFVLFCDYPFSQQREKELNKHLTFVPYIE